MSWNRSRQSFCSLAAQNMQNTAAKLGSGGASFASRNAVKASPTARQAIDTRRACLMVRVRMSFGPGLMILEAVVEEMLSRGPFGRWTAGALYLRGGEFTEQLPGL